MQDIATNTHTVIKDSVGRIVLIIADTLSGVSLGETIPEGTLGYDKNSGALQRFATGAWGTAVIDGTGAAAPTFTGDVNVNGTLTPVGRLALPMGEIEYFDTTGTAVVCAAQSNGSTNMVVAPLVTAVSGNEFQFDNGGADDGRLRYTGTTTRMFHIALTWSVVAVTAGDKFVLGVAINGTPKCKVIQTCAGANVQGSAIHCYEQLATNDYIECYIGNMTAGRNITVQTMNIFAMGM